MWHRCRSVGSILYLPATYLLAAAEPLRGQAVGAAPQHVSGSLSATPTPPFHDADLVTRTLVARGFANVATMVEGSSLFVTFENTRYRDLRRALREVAAEVQPLLHADGELVLVPSVDGVPLGMARFGAAIGPNSSEVGDPGHGQRTSLSLAGVPRALRSTPLSGASYGRVDVVVHPWFEASFGDYEEPVRSRTGVAPEVRMTLLRGLRLSAQVLFTLQDDLPTGESRVRPALVTLSQTARLPRNVFVQATAGTFTPNRYGANVHVRAYTPGGRWFAGAELGQTGRTSFARDGWERSPMDSRTALVEAGWRDVRTGLAVQGAAGAFLGDQQGIRLDVVRQFGEVDFGGFVTTTWERKNGGVSLRIPVGTRRHPRPGALRVRAADAFRWEYRYFGGVPGGRRFAGGVPEVQRWLHF